MDSLVVQNRVNNNIISADIFKKWLAFAEVKKSSMGTYSRAIRRFIQYINDNAIIQPTRADVKAYRESLLTELKPTTVFSYLEAVKQFFAFTESNGIYPDITRGLKNVRIDRDHKRNPLTKNQCVELLDSIERKTLTGKRDYALISLMITTGLRVCSVAEANIEDIQSCGDDVVLYYRGKGHNEKATFVKLAEPVEKAIRDYLMARGKADGNSPLFVSTSNRNTNQGLTTKTISTIVKSHLVDIGLDSPKLTAHSMRHTTATLNLLNGGTLEETQQLLDHANINTTLIYAHHLTRLNNKSENRIAGALFGV